MGRIPSVEKDVWISYLKLLGVRPEVLDYFEEPKLLVSELSMERLLQSATGIEEAASGNVSADKGILTIIGGTSTKKGKSWVYWNLPESATKFYIKCKLADDDVPYGIGIHFCNDDGGVGWANPPDFFIVDINVAKSAEDFELGKVVGGTYTRFSYESVDLSANQFYRVEVYIEGDGDGNWNFKTWRDGTLKFDESHTETAIKTIESVRFGVNDNSTTAAATGKVMGQVVMIYE